MSGTFESGAGHVAILAGELMIFYSLDGALEVCSRLQQPGAKRLKEKK